VGLGKILDGSNSKLLQSEQIIISNLTVSGKVVIVGLPEDLGNRLVKVKVKKAPEGVNAPLGVYWHRVQLLAMDQLQINQKQTVSTVLQATQQNIQDLWTVVGGRGMDSTVPGEVIGRATFVAEGIAIIIVMVAKLDTVLATSLESMERKHVGNGASKGNSSKERTGKSSDIWEALTS